MRPDDSFQIKKRPAGLNMERFEIAAGVQQQRQAATTRDDRWVMMVAPLCVTFFMAGVMLLSILGTTKRIWFIAFFRRLPFLQPVTLREHNSSAVHTAKYDNYNP
eukprot:gnl/MRDRNA2_/MRDRNA2_84263_c0_seq1.p1 gnl/MRDRNA2_/MRDRNA2_84263_c0~~gnl/MRDRNA2_/MRDRNA2_84263_c0_seq1.p1  ORF type:complete len:105 (+),score=13.74 gnl/MRDRNA2_/MRDRNA2_84263_c0_seq1:100-414(+)